MKAAAHRIRIEGAPGSLASQTWHCTCGQWSGRVPSVGPYGRTTAKARIAQTKMAHGKHVRAALRREAAALERAAD